MRTLLIDDLRILPNSFGCIDLIARNYLDGINALENNKWDLLYLDHDLGEEKTGYDILCWLEENNQYLPGKVVIISSNPVGRKRMEQVLEKLY